MWRLSISPEARGDIQALSTYLRAEAGPRAAARYLRALQARIARLREMPFAGVLTEDHGGSIRFVPCRRHIIYYEVASDRVLVLRVLHHARDRDAILRGVQEEAVPFETFA